MFVTLSYEPEKKETQPEVKAEENTEEKANKAIKKGKEDAKDKNDD